MIDIKNNIVNYETKELKPAEYNPRTITKKEYKKLKTSIQKFGFVEPIIINKHKERDNVVIGGHQRLKVLQELKVKKVPCIEVVLSIEDERELNIRLNKNTGKFDFDILANEFEIDELLHYGFEPFELDIEVNDIDDEEDDDKPVKIEITETNKDKAIEIYEELKKRKFQVKLK